MLEELQLEPPGAVNLQASVTELKIIAEKRHRFQLFAESMKVAGELLHMNGITVDKITIYALLTNLTENTAKPFKILLDFANGRYRINAGDEYKLQHLSEKTACPA